MWYFVANLKEVSSIIKQLDYDNMVLGYILISVTQPIFTGFVIKMNNLYISNMFFVPVESISLF